MFGIGLPEFVVIGVVAMFVFGPDKLPDFARQAGRVVRQVRRIAHQATEQIRSDLGPDYSDFELTDLDPRRAIRKHVMEVWTADDDDSPDSEADRRTRREGLPSEPETS